MTRLKASLCLSAAIVAMFAQSSAWAQADTAAGRNDAGEADVNAGDIVVTARKRDETLTAVPVAVSAIGGEALAQRGITNLEGIARAVPQLFLASSSGSIQGGALGLRGISAGDGNPFGDQAVAFNIDGVVVARSTPRQMSEFDLQQVEVLKGPQALYYGKNSPGGIIVLRTADPTNSFEAGVNTLYEVNAGEWRTQAFVSTPLTDSLGLRIAGQYARMDGWLDNSATQGTPYSRDNRDEPRQREFGGRVTLKFDDGGPFNARWKFGYGYRRGSGQYSTTQRIFCAPGNAAVIGNDDCTADDRINYADLGTIFGTGGINTVTGAPFRGYPQYRDGVQSDTIRQYLSGLELNYDLTPTLTLSSSTGYYRASIASLSNSGFNDSSAPFNPGAPGGAASASGTIAIRQDLRMREISEELRLSSAFDGPFNFMAGGYYQHQKLAFMGAAAVNAVNPIQLFPPVEFFQRTEAYSVFGSISVKPVETIELSGGARYSREKKSITAFRLFDGAIGGAAFAAGQQIPFTAPEATFTNTSPEITLSWRPSRDLTVYGGWKRGFLSGGYIPSGNDTNTTLINQTPYDQQVVEGFEAGVKAVLFNGSLRATFALYDYDINGLQVNVNLPGPPTRQIVSNAADAYSRGAEASIDWRTPVDGLSLRGSLAYNKARYLTFDTGPCYGGQTIAMGCDLGLNSTNGRFTQQDLSGQPLVRAPDWGAAIGGTYALALNDGSKITFATDANYSSQFYSDSLNSPMGIQPSYWLIDASVRFELKEGFEFSLIGRNLTNEYYYQRSSAVPLSGGPSGVATSFLPDQVAAVSRGRELAVRVGYRF